MLLAIDVGNTNVAAAAIAAGEPAAPRRFETHADATVAELERDLGGFDNVDEIVLASVVPALTERVREIAARHDIRLLVADHTTVPIEARVDRPAEVGADRLVNALATARLYGTPAVVVDFGTATTFDVVGADGAYLGGAIAPGIELGLHALHRHTAQLPEVVVAMPPAAIGKSTVAAMQSGTVIGYLGLVRGLVEAIARELGATPKVILTGGLSAAAWAKEIAGVTAVDPLLTLRGLAMVHAATATPATAATAAGER